MVLEKIITEMALQLINLKNEISEMKKEKSLIENTEKNMLIRKVQVVKKLKQ